MASHPPKHVADRGTQESLWSISPLGRCVEAPARPFPSLVQVSPAQRAPGCTPRACAPPCFSQRGEGACAYTRSGRGGRLANRRWRDARERALLAVLRCDVGVTQRAGCLAKIHRSETHKPTSGCMGAGASGTVRHSVSRPPTSHGEGSMVSVQ